MASYKDIIEGLKILSKYEAKELDSNNIGALHDVIYASRNQEVSEEDKKSLDDLGWFWSKEYKSWAKFV